MKLTLQQAAAALGKTRRQVQYLIQEGRLPAKKVGGRWAIDSADLDIDPQAAQRALQRDGHLRASIDEALRPKPAKRRYSLQDLKAFQLLLPVYRNLITADANADKGNAAAAAHLRAALEHLAQGCHRFGHEEKALAYRAARDAASLGVLELILDSKGDRSQLVRTLEDEFMAALAGLLRRVDRKRGKWE